MSLITLLRSITVLSASSLTVTSLGAFATVGASSAALTTISNVSSAVFPFDVPLITNSAVPF